MTAEEYAPGSQDFSSVVLAAKDAGAEVVLALPNPPDGLALAKQMKELDFNASVYMFIRATDGLSWADNLGADGNYFMLMPGWSPDLKFDGVADMAAAYVGGLGTLAGPVIGTIFFILIRDRLAVALVDIHQAVFGILFIIVVIAFPGGFVEAWNRLRRWLWQMRYGKR